MNNCRFVQGSQVSQGEMEHSVSTIYLPLDLCVAVIVSANYSAVNSASHCI